ncbi:MAG TPA: hypothetical protein VGQ07_07725 [Nitrospirales bacterium]|jgi:hypothetical protein|nr:hypothetical protein [Nitrospirales bacterium]
MRNQELRRAILHLLYERALEVPQSLIAGIETREIAHQLGVTSREFAFNALYLDGKGLITSDKSANGSDHHYNAIMLTPVGIDAIENPAIMDRLAPLAPKTNARNRRRSPQRRVKS